MAQASFASNVPITQVFYVNIPPSLDLGDISAEPGQIWTKLLDIIASSAGFVRLYWGRWLEEPEKVQLHVGIQPFVLKLTLWDLHHSFLSSSEYVDKVFPILASLGVPDSAISTRHVSLTHQVLANPFSKPLLGYPIGTAIYKSCNAAWHEGAWPLWTRVVRHVSVCMNIAGGQVLEPVDGMGGNYCVYVGWQTVKHHDNYHHTDHFKKHSVILRIGHEGWTEYGHLVFMGIRENIKERL
ncbi:hypothetical protein PG996_008250 [Apiospora saccharicola]|uniref:Uncharacterized protein n=1 Tax=Apiospora saccharicola TaxID=335842 RepID=A0ABR1UXE4_9PEZI